MKKIHPYRYMRPRRITLASRENLSYSVSRYDEDQDIRFGFGQCGQGNPDEPPLEIAELDYAWLGVVFHIVLNNGDEEHEYQSIYKAKDDIARVKQIAKQHILNFIEKTPNKLLYILETIHEASREQGHLEVIKNTIGAMNVALDLTEHKA